jgi:tmRNA-binding protein
MKPEQPKKDYLKRKKSKQRDKQRDEAKYLKMCQNGRK